MEVEDDVGEGLGAARVDVHVADDLGADQLPLPVVHVVGQVDVHGPVGHVHLNIRKVHYTRPPQRT